MADFVLNGYDAVRDTREKPPMHRASNVSVGDLREVALGRVRQYWQRNTNGWLESHIRARPIDQQGRPVPWITYPCRFFLEQRLKKTFRLFEYGSGYSTIYWSTRVAEVTSCEHNEAFYQEIKPQLPANVTYLLRQSPEPYINAPLEQNSTFDIVVVDGVKKLRSRCAATAIRVLSSGGVIIWDNTDMKRFEEGVAYLRQAGFRQLDFRGHGPIWAREWMTSIFYRGDNCLEI